MKLGKKHPRESRPQSDCARILRLDLNLSERDQLAEIIQWFGLAEKKFLSLHSNAPDVHSIIRILILIGNMGKSLKKIEIYLENFICTTCIQSYNENLHLIATLCLQFSNVYLLVRKRNA